MKSENRPKFSKPELVTRLTIQRVGTLFGSLSQVRNAAILLQAQLNLDFTDA